MLQRYATLGVVLDGDLLLEIEGPIVASRVGQEPGERARLFFTVEQAKLRGDDE